MRCALACGCRTGASIRRQEVPWRSHALDRLRERRRALLRGGLARRPCISRRESDLLARFPAADRIHCFEAGRQSACRGEPILGLSGRRFPVVLFVGAGVVNVIQVRSRDKVKAAISNA